MKEVNPFETSGRTAALDPTKAVAKYRRSAAGSVFNYPLRTTEQLQFTVKYLSELLLQESFSLPAIEFVENRLRAVQVEVTKLQARNVADMQRHIVRIQIVILFLTMEEPNYERTFGTTALWTALVGYWDCADRAHDDELLALVILCELNESLLTDMNATCASSNDTFTCLYRKHYCMRAALEPLSQWTLQLTIQMQLGHWHVALRFLARRQDEFGLLARCCLAPSVPYMQWRGLQTYNFSIRESILASDVAELLFFASTNSSVWHGSTCSEFAQSFGLPITEDKKITFKSNAIKDFQPQPKLLNEFVFGSAEANPDRLRLLLTGRVNSI
jgi:hypothetical protein